MRDQLTTELVELTRGWNDFDDVPRAQQQKARDLGAKLSAAGGLHMMQDAYYEAKGRNRSAGALGGIWHGIGGWAM